MPNAFVCNVCHFKHRIYGPNSEIEWNKEGSRGFLIINRKPSQTALATVAGKASQMGETLNKQLKHPCDTSRDRVLHNSDQDTDACGKTVTNDPTCVNSIIYFNFPWMLHSFQRLVADFCIYIISESIESKTQNGSAQCHCNC